MSAIPVERLETAAYRIVTDYPEADGTLEWDSTTLVLVRLRAGGKLGLGYSYAGAAAAQLIHGKLKGIVEGRDALAVPHIWMAMVRSIRNLGRPGICSMAIAAVDNALWDLKAKLLDLPLVELLGRARDAVPVYGSGGFTSYPMDRLREQLGAWVAAGLTRVKMKVGSHPDQDIERVREARRVIGPAAELFVDANGAYDRKQALAFAEAFAECGVSWFEEPVSSDDREGLRLLRDRAPAGMEITSGEYGYDLYYFRRMLAAGAVDVVQADAGRCGGISGLIGVDALCRAYGLPLSAHTAPALHLAAGCALPAMRHLEWFHDHARIERLLFDGAVQPENGLLRPDLTRPGLGLELREADAARYRIWQE